MILQCNKLRLHITSYRVSHIEMHKVNWLWQMKRWLRFSISYLRWPIQEVMSFGFYQRVFKKVILAGFNSLRQKGCQISVKNWIFDDPFYKKGQVLIIWVLRTIKPSGSVIFLMNWGCWGHWGHWGCRGHWGHWGCRGFKVCNITTDDFRVILGIEFSFSLMSWKRYMFCWIMKYHVEFQHLFCRRLLRPDYITCLKTFW